MPQPCGKSPTGGIQCNGNPRRGAPVQRRFEAAKHPAADRPAFGKAEARLSTGLECNRAPKAPRPECSAGVLPAM